MRPLAALACWLACAALVADEAPAPRLSAASALLTAHYAIDSDAEPAVARRFGAVFEAYHAYLAAQFAGHVPRVERRFTVRLCRDRASFLAYGAANCRNFSRGWFGYYFYGAKPEECELVLSDLGDNHAVLFHEAFHQFMHRAYPGIQAWPQWFNEGLADLFGRGRLADGVFTIGRVDAGDRALVRDAISAQRALPLVKLVELGTRAWNGEDQLLHYAEGYLLAHFLVTNSEPGYRAVIPAFLTALSERQDYPAAFAVTLGMLDGKRLERDFRAFVAAGD
jgi:hypothetical protein